MVRTLEIYIPSNIYYSAGTYEICMLYREQVVWDGKTDLTPLTTRLSVTTANTITNPSTAEDAYASYRVWVGAAGTNYRIYVVVTAKVNLTQYKAELFNSTGQHPVWVGGNPYYGPALPAGWSDYFYWEPVAASEMPCRIVFTPLV